MPDFAMCSGHNCLLKDTCWRACAKPSPMQNFIAPPFDPATKTCRVYMPTGGFGPVLPLTRPLTRPLVPAPKPARTPVPTGVAKKSRRAPAKLKPHAVDEPHGDEESES